MLAAIAKPLGALLKLIYDMVGNYGISIILFTILTKILLLPINIKQTQSTKKMNELNPKIKALQAKYKNDKERLNEKLMELYKEEKYNPAGGCLPLLIQMPIIIALFRVLQSPTTFVFTPEQFDAISKSFLWLPDLGLPDKMYILPVLSALTTYFQMNMVAAKGNTDPNMKTMNMVMPIMLGWITVKFPSGLAMYWVVGNLFTIAQQFLMTKTALNPEGGK